MSTVHANQDEEFFISMSRNQAVRIAIAGAVAGLCLLGLAWLLDSYIFQAVMCQGDQARCSDATGYAHATAAIMVAIGSVIALIRLQVFRPLLVVLATAISLWGLSVVTLALPWYLAIIACMALFALSYALFSWVARIRSFVVTIIVMVALVVIVRLVLSA